MDVEILFKIAGVGIITAVVVQLLKQSGRDEMSMVATIAGLIIGLLMVLGMIDELHRRIADGMPVMGTCAGLILLAKTVEEGVPAAGDPTAEVVGGAVAPGAFGTLPVTVRRNAYGRQLGSFHAKAPFSGIEGDVPMTFIRAPYIADAHEGATPLATVDGRIVAVRAGNQLGVAFHP